MKLTIRQQLERPFPVTSIKWRVGPTNKDKSSCIPLPYFDARDVMSRLTDVVGLENWQCRYPLSDSGLLICEIGIRGAVLNHEIPRDEWVWKANGAGDTDIEAEKGKASDAFKRAAVLWGVGKYLYSLPQEWVPIKDGRRLPMQQIRILMDFLPTWATPEGYDELIKKRQA
jgi:hypothetical protein